MRMVSTMMRPRFSQCASAICEPLVLALFGKGDGEVVERALVALGIDDRCEPAPGERGGAGGGVQRQRAEEAGDEPQDQIFEAILQIAQQRSAVFIGRPEWIRGLRRGLRGDANGAASPSRGRGSSAPGACMRRGVTKEGARPSRMARRRNGLIAFRACRPSAPQQLDRQQAGDQAAIEQIDRPGARCDVGAARARIGGERLWRADVAARLAARRPRSRQGSPRRESPS